MSEWGGIEPWPSLPVVEWADTRDTLQIWTQMVGKVSLGLAPHINHWWATTLRLSANGLTTPLLPYRGGGVQLAFDLRRHVLLIDTTIGEVREIGLYPRSVADFYKEFHACLDDLAIDVPIFAKPVEVPVSIPFEEDTTHASYDAEAVTRFWWSLVSAHRVLSRFRARFVGKASPIHFFWGGFDLAVTRFSGRRAPKHPGGAPNCAPWVMEEAYSHEVSSCGYWPQGASEGIFYSYAYPEPPGFSERHVANYDKGLGEFVLPYEDVRRADDPDATLLDFLQATFDAAAELADWDEALR
jgi:hypothetical protein